MRVAILGNGYIGSNLNRVLSRQFEVALVGSADVNYHDKKTLSDWIFNNQFSVVVGAFGFTGRPNIDQAETRKKECWNLNVQVPLSVNQVCADMSVPFVHVSSGCIYTGYEKSWNETDDPNFGMFHESSFYSKTKHAFELVSAQLPGTILRIRMPFGDELNDRSLLTKLLKYDRLIDMKNSKTSVVDLSDSILHMIASGMLDSSKRTTYHMVNPEPLTTSDVIKEMRAVGICNPNWSFVPIDQIPIVAPRSNCVIESIHKDNPFTSKATELEVLRKHLRKIKETV